MCTAVTYRTTDHYFGRNLDLEYSYSEAVTVTPRRFPFTFRFADPIKSHHAIIGMAMISDGYPLYYDATNEKGLSVAGLNFPDNAVYHPPREQAQNITPFELIPWLLSRCSCVADAQRLLENVNLADVPFSKEYPLTPLHWIVADSKRSIVLEPLKSGLKILENPVGVLTNNPPFEYHLHNLKNYLNLTPKEPTNRFASQIDLTPYSRGMGALGLPGDLSSSSRFVRAAFTKMNSVCCDSELESVGQFFHILGSVEQQAGCVQVGEKFEKTVYSSCCNTNKGIYYYTTYNNRQITGIDMHSTDLESAELTVYPLEDRQRIRML